MINYEELTFLSEIYKGLNLITVNGQNAVLIGKCIESLEQFLEIKRNELMQYEQMMAKIQAEKTLEENPIKEE